MVELTEREKLIFAITYMNASPRASMFPPKLLGHALNQVREVIAPSIPSSELHDYVEAVMNQKNQIISDLMKALSKIKM